MAEDPMRTLGKILAEHGPLHEDDLAHRLRAAGVTDPNASLGLLRLEIELPAKQLVDDRWVWLPSLLAGRVFTHRVTADELAYDILTVTPDLGPISGLSDYLQYQRLANGSPVHLVVADYDDELLEERDIPVEVADASPVLLLESGTLAASGVTEGDLVGMRLSADGLVVERVSAAAPGAAGAALAATLDGDEPEHLDSAVWTACAADPALFTEPAPPLGEIADGHGLAHHGEWLGPGGFDFDQWDLERDCARLAERHDLDADDAFALYTLIKLHGSLARLLTRGMDEDEAPADEDEDETAATSDEIDDLVGELGAVLADPFLADLLVDETVGGGAGAAALGMLAETLEPKVPPAARVACRWLRATALERIGDIEEAERELLAAESMDVDWPLPLLDLAHIASDRGDAERGLALLHRAGAEPDHPMVDLLQRYRVQPRSDVGRNEPCWCGSGRKYKKCHLGYEELPLAERAAWLYAKAVQHMLQSGWTELLGETAYERSRYAGDDDPLDALAEAMADPLVRDAVLFEGGAFEEFVAVRGPLLPADELALAEQWLQVDRTVFEIEHVQPGQGVSLRDMRTGDTHEVRERAASRQMKPGQLICARVVPAGDTMQGFGGIEPVAPHERDDLIELLDDEPDPVELVAQLSRRFAPADDPDAE